MRPIFRTLCLLMLALQGFAAAAANMPPPNQQGRGHRSPPPEAYEACEGKKAGDEVTFTTPRGEKVAATCNMMPARLVAIPDHPPQGGQGDNPLPPAN